MIEWQELLLILLALVGLPVSAWTFWQSWIDRLQLRRDGRNGLLKMISNRDLRSAGARVIVSSGLGTVGVLLLFLPPIETPYPALRWAFHGTLLLLAAMTIFVSSRNGLEHREIRRRLFRIVEDPESDL